MTLKEKILIPLMLGALCFAPAGTEAFAKALQANAVRTLGEWRDLYGQLLSNSDCGHLIKYDESYQPKDDNVTKY